MPVLPLVGSSSTVSGSIWPSRSAASIMATPMRSFTLPQGLKLSSLATSRPGRPAPMRLSRTSGVRPTSAVMSGAMLGMGPRIMQLPRRA